MHTFLIRPTDVLFFKDGRPMGGASPGHGATWPLPHVLTAALHGALHRAQLDGVHGHDHRIRSQSRGTDTRKFGTLKSAGPFPVCIAGGAPRWYFPRPLDAGILEERTACLLHPIFEGSHAAASSLPSPLRYAVGSSVPPTKDSAAPWWSEGAWSSYLGTPARDALAGKVDFKKEGDFSDAEHTYGIGINSDTGTTGEGLFYSADYLRLREGFRLGALAEAPDKDFRDPTHGNDLLGAALERCSHTLIFGGQQRTATCELPGVLPSRLPLPAGKQNAFEQHRGKFLVKWALLTPAIWPRIEQGEDQPAVEEHTGGWLPNWIRPTDGRVMLKEGNPERGPRESREEWRKRVQELPPLDAHLVAAVVGKPLPITGFALAHEAAERKNGGAKSTHLAAPAGCVYYFEASSPQAATELANALNWHGSDLTYRTIRRRRSTLMGEKGFGLGVCGTWNFHPASL